MKHAPLAFAALLFSGCTGLDTGGAGSNAPASNAQDFLRMYNRLDQRLATVSAEANWSASTDVTDQHTGERIGADKALAVFRGSPYVIDSSRKFLQESLSDLEFRQLDKILLNAAESPGTIPDVVRRRVEAEARLSARLDGFTFCAGKPGPACAHPLSVTEIDETLLQSRNLAERQRVWEISKQTGPALKDDVAEVRDLRNMVARQLGYSSYFHLQVADYGMTVGEMVELMDKAAADMQPLYQSLHKWTSRRLAERYGQPAPEKIPAHWIGNRWGQAWPGLVDGADLDPLFRDKEPQWIVEQAERFYTSLGMVPLPESFWEKSDLYQLPPGSNRRKNTHASAWHVDGDKDVRSLMSVVPSFYWFSTAHHELGHIYYYMAYSTPEVPHVLREGMNRAFHEALGDLIAIAARQEPYLKEIGLMPADAQVDRQKLLLNEALDNAVVVLPWSAGVMTHFEYALYEENLDEKEFNERWWQLVERYQGIVPPSPRGEEFCDGCTKTHIVDDPAQYYDYALASLITYQLHDYIARQILHQDPHNCNYYGNKEVGEWLMGIMRLGATRDWRTVLREATGEDLSSRAMLEYFQPLKAYLDKESQ